MWISCNLKTSSHTLSSEVFSVFQSGNANTRICIVSDNEMTISVRHIEAEDDKSLQIFHDAHHVINSFLIAFNVASMGFFYWKNIPQLCSIFSTSSDFDGANRVVSALIAEPEHHFENKVPLTKIDVKNAILVFGILAKESSFAIDNEYIKGILLLRMQFYDVNFRTEAFICFYKALEFFVTSRILKTNKLENELKDIQRGLEIIGMKKELYDEFKNIYIIRSSLAAHTQKEPRALTFDEVMKAKIFLDFVIHRTFVTKGHALMKARYEV